MIITIASVISVAISWGVYVYILNFLTRFLYMRIIQLAIPVILAVIIYVLFLYLMKVDEIKILKQILKR